MNLHVKLSKLINMNTLFIFLITQKQTTSRVIIFLRHLSPKKVIPVSMPAMAQFAHRSVLYPLATLLCIVGGLASAGSPGSYIVNFQEAVAWETHGLKNGDQERRRTQDSSPPTLDSHSSCNHIPFLNFSFHQNFLSSYNFS